MSKTLVTYFSATGTTARVAQQIAEAVHGDLYEIAPKTPYSAADLNWHDKQSRSSVEMRDESCRPEIKDSKLNLEGYDTIFVGFPIWWYVEPRIIDTFLEAHDFAGKTLIPFATSGGSGFGASEARMKSLTPGSTWRPGKLLNGGNVASWAQKVIN